MPLARARPSISAVIPAYNEEQSIEACVNALEAVLPRMTDDFEIVVVNDGSRDATGRILEALQASRPFLTVVHSAVNRGLGATLRAGFERCTKQLVFYSDADLPFDFNELARALETLHQHDADLVTGFRYDRRSEGLKRTCYSRVYNFLILALFGLRTKDVNFSFKLIKIERLRQLHLRSEGSFIDAELLIKAAMIGLRREQIGVVYSKRQHGQSRLSGLGTILNILKELIAQYPELAQNSDPDGRARRDGRRLRRV